MKSRLLKPKTSTLIAVLLLGVTELLGCVALRPPAEQPASQNSLKSPSPKLSSAAGSPSSYAISSLRPSLSTSTTGKPDQAAHARVIQGYGKLPLHFEANQGQTDAQVKFISRGSGYTMFLTGNEAVMVLRKSEQEAEGKRLKTEGRLSARYNPKSEIENPKSAVLRMKLMGSNPAPQVVGLDELPGKSNYFIGNDPEKWRTNVPNYGKVKYQDVYPGGDLVYYGNQRQLEYDFIVAPGADPSAIKLAFEGADKIEVDAKGDIVLQTAIGDVHLHRPLVYQEFDGVRKEIPGAYVFNPKSKTQNPSRSVFKWPPTTPADHSSLIQYSPTPPTSVGVVMTLAVALPWTPLATPT